MKEGYHGCIGTSVFMKASVLNLRFFYQSCMDFNANKLAEAPC